MGSTSKTVTVQVRARGERPFPWAGELWQPEWREFDASPAHVEDLLKAPAGNIDVRWPDDYVAHNGRRPAAPSGEPPAARTAGERVGQLEVEAKAFHDRAVAAERELAAVKLAAAGNLKHWQDEHAKAIEQVRRMEGDLQASEKARLALVEAAAKTDAAVANAVKAAKAEAAAEIDTIKARAAAEIEKGRAEADKLIADALVEIDAKTKAAESSTKPKKG